MPELRITGSKSIGAPSDVFGLWLLAMSGLRLVPSQHATIRDRRGMADGNADGDTIAFTDRDHNYTTIHSAEQSA
jgi:hypothetical protein